MIPKIIHYCWFGGKPLPEKFEVFIAGWHRLMPDYEYRLWNEDNAPMHLPYMKAAYANQKWANLSNYTRLHALNDYGGIYLDTDIELVKSFDPLLINDCFVGFESKDVNELNCINNAVIGAQRSNPFVIHCMDRLLHDFDGLEYAHLSSPVLTTYLLKEAGLHAYGEQQVSNVKVYPIDYFFPYSWKANFDTSCITENTFCIHHWEKSWEDNKPAERTSFLRRLALFIQRKLKISGI